MAFFDQFGGDDNYDAFSESGYRRLLKEFDRLIRPKPGEVLGDFGCGSGAITYRISRAYDLQVRGVDISEAMILANQKKYPNLRFEQKDIENTGYDPQSFDIIVFSGVLHHFPDFQQVLKEAYRLLRPGGRIFAFDPNYHNPIMWLYRADQSPFSTRIGLTENERLLKKQEIHSELSKVGFSNITVTSVGGVFRRKRKVDSKAVHAFLLPYNVIEKGIDVFGLGPIIGSFIISVATKASPS